MLLSLGKSFDEFSQEPRDAVAGRLADSVWRVNRAVSGSKLLPQCRCHSGIGDRDRRIAFDAKVAV